MKSFFQLQSILYVVGIVFVIGTPLDPFQAQEPSGSIIDLQMDDSSTKLAILNYIATNPDATLKQVASTANKYLKKHGVTFTILVGQVKNIPPTLLTFIEESGSGTVYRYKLISGEREFSLSGGEGPLCSGLDVFFPLARYSKEKLTLVKEGREFEIEIPENFYIPKTEVVDPKAEKIVSTHFQPRQGLPFEVGKEGNSIYWRYSLWIYREKEDTSKSQKNIDSWWNSIRTQTPGIATWRPKDPYLVLEIKNGEFRFVDDPSLMIETKKEIKGSNLLYYGKVPGKELYESKGFQVVYPYPCT